MLILKRKGPFTVMITNQANESWFYFYLRVGRVSGEIRFSKGPGW